MIKGILTIATKMPTLISDYENGVPKKDNGLPDYKAYRHPITPVVFIQKYWGSRTKDFHRANAVRTTGSVNSRLN